MLTPLFTKWFDKRNALIVAALIAIINANIPVVLRLLGVSWFPANGDPILIPILVASAFIGGSIVPVIFITTAWSCTSSTSSTAESTR